MDLEIRVARKPSTGRTVFTPSPPPALVIDPDISESLYAFARGGPRAAPEKGVPREDTLSGSKSPSSRGTGFSGRGDLPAPVTDPRIAEVLAVLADEYEALDARGRESLLLRFWALNPDLRERAAARQGPRLARLAGGGGAASGAG